MKDPFDEEIAQLGHEHVGLGRLAQGHGKRTDVIMVTMCEGDGIQFLFADELIERQAFAPFVFGVRAGIHEEAMAFEADASGAGAGGGGGIEIDNAHENVAMLSNFARLMATYKAGLSQGKKN